MPKQNGKITYEAVRRLISSPGSVVHFVGIGGVSMYTLARMVLESGARVTGSDRVINERCKDLMARGVKFRVGQDASHVNGVSLVVYSSAISDKNPELLASRNLGIHTISRAELMGAIMLDYKTRIGVSGTHGKSTTVAMLDAIFTSAMAGPTTLSGAELQNGSPLRIGRGELMLYEACEYCDSFLHFSPGVAVALNMELDHTDYFEDISAIKRSFTKALSRASSYALVNMDDENLSEIIPDLKCRVVTFGQTERADWRYLITAFLDSGLEFTLYHHGTRVQKFKLNIPGTHNVQNAAAAAIVALEQGVRAEVVPGAIESFVGVPRRLELVGEHHGRPVYYDYAHHPTEIIASINTLKQINHDLLTVIFKPHTYSRTLSLWSEFSEALSLADHIIVTDIFAAREDPIQGVTARRLAHNIGERAIYSPDYEVVSAVDSSTHGTIVIMGAGDTENIKNDLLGL